MARYRFFNNNIEPSCSYCTQGQASADDQNILCTKKGVVQPDFFCKKFVYDPLKRIPKRLNKLPSFSLEDFSID